MGFITDEQLADAGRASCVKSGYGAYLLDLLDSR